MKRLFLWVTLLIFLSGCADRNSLCADGIYGRTAITPPATGTAKISSNPYYAAAKKASAEQSNIAQARSNVELTSKQSAAWKKANSSESTSSANKRSTSSAWNLSQETSTYDPSVQHASLTEDRSSAPSVPEQRRASRSTPVQDDTTRWTTGRSTVSSIRTCIEPPSFVHSPSNPSTEVADSSQIKQLPVLSQTPADDRNSIASNSRQPVVRILQPHAVVSGQTETFDDTSSDALVPVAQVPVASQPHVSNQAPASKWRGTTSESRSNSSVTITNVSHTSTQSSPQRAIVPGRIVNIADLPDPGTRARRQRRLDTRVRPVSAFSASRVTNVNSRSRSRSTAQGVMSSDRTRVQGQTSVTPSLRYGHGSSYVWLRGRLEYSEIAKRWKLRYIPIDGKVDQYGGSVVLRSSTLLDDQREGDFVEVQGRLLAGENQDWGYAPIYEMAQLRPIGK